MKGSRVGIKGQETPEHSSRDPDAVLCSAMVVLDSPLQRQSANRPPVPAEEECGLLSAAHLLKPLPLRRRSGLQMPLTWTPGGAFAQTLQRKVPRKNPRGRSSNMGVGRLTAIRFLGPTARRHALQTLGGLGIGSCSIPEWLKRSCCFRRNRSCDAQ